MAATSARSYVGLIDIAVSTSPVGPTMASLVVTDDDSLARTIRAEEVLPGQASTSRRATERSSLGATVVATLTNSGDRANLRSDTIRSRVSPRIGQFRPGRRICFVNSKILTVMRIIWVNAKGPFLGRLHYGSSDTFLSVKE
jgi:hypothetical protein